MTIDPSKPSLRKNKRSNSQHDWTIEKSADLYGLNRWGKRYFSINQNGQIEVHPRGLEKGLWRYNPFAHDEAMLTIP